MGINLGALLAPLICGPVGQRVNWRLGFALAGIGMAIGVFTFLRGRKHLGEAGLKPVGTATPEEAAAVRRQLRAGLGLGAGIPLLLGAVHLSGAYEFTLQSLVDGAGVLLILAVIAFFAWVFVVGDWTPQEKKRLAVVAVLFVGSSLFWSAFEQAGSSLNIFADRYTQRDVLGLSIPASVYQSLNAGYIILLAPVFAWLWVRLGDKQPSSPAKFSIGLVLVGLGFVAVTMAAVKGASGAKVSPGWLLVCYFFHTSGELCLSPVGLSAMTKLAPARVAGLMMGVWFMSIAMGNYVGGRLAAFYGDLPISDLFQTTATFAIVAGIILALVARPVARMMGGIR